jgi:hypothetical protein
LKVKKEKMVQLPTIIVTQVETLWKKWVFGNWPLQFSFWLAMTIYNPLYLYVVSAIKQVTWIARIATHHIYGATQL